MAKKNVASRKGAGNAPTVAAMFSASAAARSTGSQAKGSNGVITYEGQVSTQLSNWEKNGKFTNVILNDVRALFRSSNMDKPPASMDFQAFMMEHEEEVIVIKSLYESYWDAITHLVTLGAQSLDELKGSTESKTSESDELFLLLGKAVAEGDKELQKELQMKIANLNE